MREPPVLQQTDVTWVMHEGRRLGYFAGSDYLRLSWHPEVRAAVVSAVAEFGPNAAASRMTTGNLPVYAALERAVTRHFGGGVATLTTAGYVAPMIAAQALAPDHGHVLVAEGAHACLSDAARLTGLPVARFPARDPAGLARAIGAIRACGPRARVLVMTDGLAPAGGGVAPVRALLEALPGTATLLVDDAHGVGVLGKRGRGTLEWSGVDRRRVVLTFTLSKAFGCYGGVVLGGRELRQAILARSTLFSGNTVLPPPLAAGSLAALEVVAREGAARRQRLHAAVDRVKEAFGIAGQPAPTGPGPVFAVAPESPAGVERLRRRLLSADIHPPLIRYPGGPAPRFFRFALSSEHSAHQVEALRSALVDFLRHDS